MPSPLLGPLAAAWSPVTPERVAGLLRPADDCLPVPAADRRQVWDGDHGLLDRATVHDLQRRAGAERGTWWPQPLLRSYARCFRDGDREEYEALIAERQWRLSRATVLAAVTQEQSWLDEVADGVLLLCEQSTWCWPAHEELPRRLGQVLPSPDEPFLDLGAGEVVGQLAWVDQVLGAMLDERAPGLRARIRREARTRVIEPFLQRRDWHWLGLDGDAHNWNPWIHGNVIVAALRLVDDPAQRARTIALAVEGLDRYLAVLPDDGAIDEGYGYWWNGACRALEALDLLHHATDGALDAFAIPPLRATVAFPHRMHLGGDWYLNVSDNPARQPEQPPWHSLYRAALRVGDDDARRHAAAHRRPGEPVADERQGLGRLLRALTDRDWLDASCARSPLPREVWLPSTQVLLARCEPGTARGLTLAIKGGHNGENHNHNDVGSVVVAVNGVPVLVDAGRPTYTAQTFGPDRYAIWTMRSSWHNVPEIRGTAQATGAAFAARAVTVDLADDTAALRLDLAGAYPRPDVRHWWRTARLDRRHDRVTIVDEWSFTDPRPADGGCAPTCLHLLLAGEVELADGRITITAPQAAGTVILSWSAAAAQVQAEVRILDDPWLTRVWGDHLTRLTISPGDLPNGTLTLTAEVGR